MATPRRLRAMAAVLLCYACVLAGEPRGPDHVDLRVVMVNGAAGTGAVEVDPRIPAELRRKLQRLALAYQKYDLLSQATQRAALRRTVVFDMARKGWKIEITPQVATATRVHLHTHVYKLERGTKKTIHERRWNNINYDSSFLFHFPDEKTRGRALLMGVAASKPR